MAKQSFVNLLDPTKTELTRSGGIYSKVVIEEGITGHDSIRIYPDETDLTIKVVKEENYKGQEDFINPFDDWTENDENKEPIFWIATEKFSVVPTVFNTMKILRIDGGFLLALIKGKMEVSAPDGSTIPLARKYGGSSDVTAFNSEDNFLPFRSKDRRKSGVVLENYSWNVLFDIEMKQWLGGQDTVISKEDTNIQGIDFRPADFYKLDNGVYENQIQESLKAQELEKELKMERIREDRIRAEERRDKEQKKAKETKKKSEVKSSADSLRDGATEFLNMVGIHS